MESTLGATEQGGKIIQIDEARIKGHLDQVVRETVEETLNALLDAEADRLCKAGRYERSPDRTDTRAGHYKRALHTKAGEVELNAFSGSALHPYTHFYQDRKSVY